jgi:hypothetical protein
MEPSNTTTAAPSATATQAANIAGLQAKLSEYDYFVILDGSGSMSEEDMGGKSRWEYMQESITSMAREFSKIDSDGITLGILSNGQFKIYDGVNADKVKEVFANHRPSGSTPMAQALEQTLQFAKKSSKKKFILVARMACPTTKARWQPSSATSRTARSPTRNARSSSCKSATTSVRRSTWRTWTTTSKVPSSTSWTRRPSSRWISSRPSCSSSRTRSTTSHRPAAEENRELILGFLTYRKN